jgi:hypothetical protein
MIDSPWLLPPLVVLMVYLLWQNSRSWERFHRAQAEKTKAMVGEDPSVLADLLGRLRPHLESDPAEVRRLLQEHYASRRDRQEGLRRPLWDEAKADPAAAMHLHSLLLTDLEAYAATRRALAKERDTLATAALMEELSARIARTQEELRRLAELTTHRSGPEIGRGQMT